MQSNCRGEFHFLTSKLNAQGTVYRKICPHTYEQNDVVELCHKYVVERHLALLFHSELPLKFWLYAFKYTLFVLNRLPIKVLSNKSPFKALYDKQLDYTFLGSFGFMCFPYLRSFDHQKL